MLPDAILFLAAFGWYLSHLVPGVYFGDCGEILSAVFTGGIPHPTGFPLYLLLSTPAAQAGQSPFHVHAVSAACAAGSLVLTRRAVLRLTGDRRAALGAALALAASLTLLVHASTARVYALQLLAVTAFVALGVRAEPGRSRAMGLGLLAGLGMGTHLGFVAGPIFVAVLQWRRRAEWARFAPWAAVFLVTGLSVYLWIPLRSHLQPLVNWTDPSNADRLWAYLSQEHYRTKMFARGAGGTLLYLREVAGAFAREWPATHWALVLAGGAWAFRGHRPLFRAVAAVAAFNLLLIGAYGVEKDLMIAYRYFLPTYAAFSLWAALAVREGLARWGRSRWVWPLAACLLVAAVPLHQYPWRHLSRCLAGHDYALDSMKTCHEGAVVELVGDNQVFTFAYAYRVLRARPDLIPVEWEGTLFPSAVERMRRTPGLTRASVEEQLFRQGGDLLYVPERRSLVASLVCRQEGLQYRVTTIERDRVLPAPPPLAGFFRERSARPHPPDREGEEIWAHLPLAQARDAFDRGDRALALSRLAEVVREGANVPYALVNASALYSLLDSDDLAEKPLQRLLKIQPHHVEARLNLGILYGKMGRYPEALAELDRALALSPGHPVALQYRARVLGLLNAPRGNP